MLVDSNHGIYREHCPVVLTSSLSKRHHTLQMVGVIRLIADSQRPDQGSQKPQHESRRAVPPSESPPYDRAPRVGGAGGFDIVGPHCILILVDEVRPHVVDHGCDLSCAMIRLYVLTTRSCSRVMALSAERIAPSCHTGI
jgi:hypothetical protein